MMGCFVLLLCLDTPETDLSVVEGNFICTGILRISHAFAVFEALGIRPTCADALTVGFLTRHRH